MNTMLIAKITKDLLSVDALGLIVTGNLARVAGLHRILVGFDNSRNEGEVSIQLKLLYY